MSHLRIALAATLAAIVVGPLAALERDEARHLLLRTGYSPTPAEIDVLLPLTREQADSWLTGLNDVRLALGTTLGIDADTPDQLEEDDPRAPHLDVYHWLTWMQDSLVQVLMP